MSDDTNWIKWQLQDVAAQDPENIESNEYEIYGEDEQGREGYTTIKITDMAMAAYERIGELEMKVNMLEQDAEELECVHLWLNDKNVPTHSEEPDAKFSLVGRIMAYKDGRLSSGD